MVFQQAEALARFAAQAGHVPMLQSQSVDERDLAKWWSRQAIRTLDLINTKYPILGQLVLMHLQLDKQAADSFDTRVSQIVVFAQGIGRLPRAQKGTAEAWGLKLGQWLEQ